MNTKVKTVTKVQTTDGKLFNSAMEASNYQDELDIKEFFFKILNNEISEQNATDGATILVANRGLIFTTLKAIFERAD